MTSKEISIRFETKEDFESGTCELTIDTTSVAGEVRLAPTVLIQDEIGDTNVKTVLGDQVRAKKGFVLSQPEASWAQVILFAIGGPPAKISVNGQEVPQVVEQSEHGWYRADFPPEWLRPGVNEVVMWGGGYVFVEPSLRPNRSSLSTDGGRTWDYDHLNPEGTLNGEYMCRLRLGQHARAGAITSAPIDLAAEARGGPVAPQIRLRSLTLTADTEEPENTGVILALRGGSTPSYTPETWSGWASPDNFLKDPTFPAERVRYTQWRAFLSTEKPSVTPSVRSIALTAEVEIRVSPPGKVEVKEFQNEKIVRSGLDFWYQEPSEKLTFLRARWPLDWIVHAGQTEMEKFILLRDWVKHQWKGWEGHCDRPWDAINILSAPAEDRGMCVHFAAAFGQCALALGYTSRYVIINHHFITEVWSDELKKWICMDAGCGSGWDGNRTMHFGKDGVVLNSLEVHECWRKSELDKVILATTDPRDSTPMGEWGGGFCRFYVPMRNNYLDVPEPAETGHGCIGYHYDGYLLWEDDLTKLFTPECSLQTARKNDLYWTLNQAELHLQQGQKPGEVLVQIDTVTPNFRAFLVSIDGGDWEERGADFVWRHSYEYNDKRFIGGLPKEAVERSGEFVWRLHEGENTLQVKPVNAFGIEGITSSVTLLFTPY